MREAGRWHVCVALAAAAALLPACGERGTAVDGGTGTRCGPAQRTRQRGPVEPSVGPAACAGDPRGATVAASGDVARGPCAPVPGLDGAALVALLRAGDYDCVEAVAEALAPLADRALLDHLLEMAASAGDGWSRRNALRVILRFADRAEGDAARGLVRVTEARRVREAALERVRADRSADVLHDAIYLLDACFFPCAAAQGALQAISDEASFPADLRFRALAAVGRLLGAKPSAADDDVDFIARSLASDEPWVRAEAAFVARYPLGERVTEAQAAILRSALHRALAIEDELVPKAYLAQALDCYEGSDLYPSLRDAWEAAHLAASCGDDEVTVRSGLAPSKTDAIRGALASERRAFGAVLGAPFETPVAGDAHAVVTVVVFATRAEYDDYMGAFVGDGAGAGGLFVERTGTLYTFERTPAESHLTLSELLQHEYAHALQARYVYPGVWGDPGYATEPRGWADEGLAELFGGFVMAPTGFTAPPRAVHLGTLCGAPPCSLPRLLAARAGYDEPGAFDYPSAWAFSYDLHTAACEVRQRLYLALREDRYRLAEFAEIAGVPSVGALEEAWHAGLAALCSSLPGGDDGSSGPGSARASAPAARDRVLRVGAPLDLSGPAAAIAQVCGAGAGAAGADPDAGCVAGASGCGSCQPPPSAR